MATENEQKLISVAATADLSAQATRYRAVTIFGALVAANQAVGTGGGVAGILKSSTRSGETASLVYDGITKGVFGAAVSTAGWPIMSGSSGYLFAATSGGLTCGRLLDTSAASGDMAQIAVDLKTLQYFAGVV